MPDAPAPRVWSRATRLAVASVVVVAVTVAVAAAVVVTTREDVPRVLPDAAAAFGDDGVLDQTLSRAVFSPSGRLLLVRTPRGIGVATGGENGAGGEVALLTPPGSRAVDAAWFPSETAVLIVEGPISTGQLAVVELDGTVRGSVPVTPSFSVGTGHGMSIAPDGRRAVVTAEERAPIGGERSLHLVIVDLEDGTVTELTSPEGADAADPFFVSDDHVVYTETAAAPDSEPRAMVLDLSTGVAVPVSPPGQPTRAVGVVNGRPAYASGDAVWVAGPDGGEPRRLARVDDHVLAVHPEGRLLVVARRGQAELLNLRQ